ILGSSLDHDLFFCSRTMDPDAKRLADFGGMFGEGGYLNPLTGANSCPAGYTPTKVFRSSGGIKPDGAMFMCHRAYDEKKIPEYAFGGSGGQAYNDSTKKVEQVNNPATG